MAPETGTYIINVTDTTGCIGIDTLLITNGSVDTVPPIISCPSNITLNLLPGACDTIFYYSVTATDNLPGFTLTQLTGIPTGGTFPIGVTTNTYLCTDQAGNTASCFFDITVVEYANPISSLVCTDLVVVYLDTTCSYVVSAGEILEGGLIAVTIIIWLKLIKLPLLEMDLGSQIFLRSLMRVKHIKFVLLIQQLKINAGVI